MEYRIREIEAKDNKNIENVIRTCLIEFGANHEGTAWTDPNLGRFSEIYNTEGNKYWVAIDENDKIVGGVGIGKLDGIENVCELQKMYCLPEARGTGISYKLIAIALEYATKYYNKCYLETLENMVAAQKFYEKYGFTRIYEPLVKTEHFACDVRYIKNLQNINNEVIEKWGSTVQYEEYKQKNRSKEEQKKINDELMNIFTELGTLKQLSVENEKVQDKIKELQDFITNNYYSCTNDVLKGLGQMYVNDERFRSNIDNAAGVGTAEFVNKAILIYCSKHI